MMIKSKELFDCKICGTKDLKGVNGLAQHIRIHANIITPKEYYKYFLNKNESFKCPHCEHEKEFWGLNGFRKTCNSPTCRNKNWKTKVRETRKQKAIRNGTYKEKKYACPVEGCSETFSYKNSVFVHIGKKHKNISKEEFYLRYINPNANPICPFCNTRKKVFKNSGKIGYLGSCGHIDCWNRSRIGTMVKRRKFNTSKASLQKYDLIKTIIPDLEKEYVDEKRYKHYWADYYSKKHDLFIEYQGMWTHGNEPFNKDNVEHLKILAIWQEKSKVYPFYNKAIDVWTVRDIDKRKLAKKHGFNFIEIWRNETDEQILAKIQSVIKLTHPSIDNP